MVSRTRRRVRPRRHLFAPRSRDRSQMSLEPQERRVRDKSATSRATGNEVATSETS